MTEKKVKFINHESAVVNVDEAGIRLDRWFKRHYPGLTNGRLQKLLRTGQIRLDGERIKSSTRVLDGSKILIPPLDLSHKKTEYPVKPFDPQLEKWVKSLVLYKDTDIIVIDKPAGLAVQGGIGVVQHIDGLLDYLQFDSPEKPRLVHRLDRDTSGVLVLARRSIVAAELARAFQQKKIRKIYWALVVGTPRPSEGRMQARLEKLSQKGFEKVSISPNGKRASTLFRTVEISGKHVSFLVLQPETGRTHQLRVHCAEGLGCPILGDGKFGGKKAHLTLDGISKNLHLHARSINIPRLTSLSNRKEIFVSAPVSTHFLAAQKLFGLFEKPPDDPFLDVRDG